MSPDVKLWCRGDVWSLCPPQGCPSQGDAHPGGKPIPVGFLSQKDALPQDTHCGDMPTPLGRLFQGKTHLRARPER